MVFRHISCTRHTDLINKCTCRSAFSNSQFFLFYEQRNVIGPRGQHWVFGKLLCTVFIYLGKLSPCSQGFVIVCMLWRMDWIIEDDCILCILDLWYIILVLKIFQFPAASCRGLLSSTILYFVTDF
jgi:hypothetical protein